MKVKDNDLLPLLLEEFPHLHLSPHALGRMWQQQLGQVDRLNASLSLDSQRQGPRTKLTSQVGGAITHYPPYKPQGELGGFSLACQMDLCKSPTCL